jgi:glycosyltransferase involved in cell wall biosynthesis
LKRLKVLVIGNRVPWPLKDGGAIATYNMLLGLSQLGVEIHFITLNTKKHFVEADTIQKAFSFCKVVKTYEIDTSLSVFKALLNLFSKRSYHIDRFTDPGFTQLIQSTIDQEQFDLIHFESLFITQYVQWLQTQKGAGLDSIPCVYRSHNIEYKIWELLAQTTKNPIKRWYLKLLAKRLKTFETSISKRFEAIVCISPIDLKDCQTWGLKAKLLQLPGGIIAHLYHLAYMNWMPNQEAMEWFHSEVWPIVHKQHPSVHFYMAGKGMPARYFKWNTTHFHVQGEVDSASEFAKDKGILVVPLNSGSGIRMKTIEAMMEGKAVVTTVIGANGLTVEKDKDCLIAHDAQSFAAALSQLILNPELRTEIAENGQLTAIKNYENTAVSSAWKTLYEGLIH